MVKIRKKIIVALAAVLALSLAAGLIFGLPGKTETASAARSEDAWVTVDEIYNDKIQVFDSANLKALYQALGGSGVTTIAALKNELDADPDKALTSLNFRTNNGGSNNVEVTFGGIKWDAVYLTKAQNTAGDTKAGDLILDLWRSSDTLTASDVSAYAFWNGGNDATKDYPSSLYSTSYIRVVALNVGGQYSIDDSTLSDEQAQNRTSQYARFTMSGTDSNGKDSLIKYIAKPSEVGYQETECCDEMMQVLPTSLRYYFPNDAYGTPGGSYGWYKSSTREVVDMSLYSSKGSGKTAYGAWKDDYLWLPSVTETGGAGGNEEDAGKCIWETDTSIRSANSDVGDGGRCYLRTGRNQNASYACWHKVEGSYGQSTGPLTVMGVRPALHLNLTSVAKNVSLSTDDWKDDEKTYKPAGVTWKIENTDMVDITPVAISGSTSWWNAATYTITASKVGKYQLKVKPKTGCKWSDGTTTEITVTYTVKPDDMTVKFDNGKLEKRRDVVFESNMSPIDLKLPDPTDAKFPISWTGVTWSSSNKSKIKIQYIVQKHEEENHNQTAIDNYLRDLKNGQHSTDWKDYDNLDDTDKTALEPMGYIVYFKAEDTEGNHNTCYDYFVVHIADEQLKITLTEDALRGFEKGVEYGDVTHTKSTFETDILGGIDKIMATAAEEGKPDIDRTADFKKNIDNFTFYLRKDDSEKGDAYYVEEDGIYLHKSTSEKVDNLPLGTYYLYVAYTSPPEGDDASKYITFSWPDGRPSFVVSARNINVTLTFHAKTYGADPSGWVTATAARSTSGASGTWYAQGEASNATDLGILGLSYTLSGVNAAPSKTTPANVSGYTVTPRKTNANYNVTFAYGTGGNKYVVNKATVTGTLTWSDADGGEYDGVVHTPSAQANGVNGAKLTLTVTMTSPGGSGTVCKNAGTYSYSADLSESDKQNYTFDSGVVRTKSFTITAKEIDSIDWEGGPYTYTGSKITTGLPTASFEGVGLDGTIDLKVNQQTSGDFKDAKTYVFEAELEGDAATNYTLKTPTHNFSIGKATITVSGTYTDSKEYDGTAYSAKVTGTGKSLTVSSSATITGFQITISTGTNKNARSSAYTGTIQDSDVTYDANNFDLTLSNAKYSITIKTKTLDASDIVWGALSFEYNGDAQAPKPKIATGVGSEGDITLSVALSGDELTSGEAIEANVGENTYTITATLPSTATNYTLKITSTNNVKTFKITPQEVTVVWSGLELQYNGKAQQPTASATDKQTNKVSPLTVKVTQSAHIAVGTYNATASTTNTNYTLKSATTTFEIVAGEIELEAAEKTAIEGYVQKTKEYNGNTTAAVNVTTDYLERFVSDQVKFTVSANYNNKNVSKATSITVKVTLTDATTFKFKASTKGVTYTVDSGNVISWKISTDVSITAKPLAVAFADYTKTYSGAAQKPTATVTTNVGEETVTLKVTVANGTTGKLTGSDAINVGIYSVTASIASVSSDTEARNYSLTNTTHNFTINKATLTFTWMGSEVDYTYVYGTTADVHPDQPTADFKGSDASTTQIVVVERSSKEFKNVGSYHYTATLQGGAADNYTISNPTQNYTITKATLVLDMTATVEFGETVNKDNVTLTVNSGFVSGDDQAEILAAAKEAANFLFTGYTAGTTGVDQTNTITVSSVNGTLDNYTVQYTSCKLTITKRRITLTLSGTLENTYGAAEHGSITASATHKGGGNWYGNAADESKLNSELAYTFAKDGSATAYASTLGAGNYTITVKWDVGSTLATNYEIVNEDTGTNYTINKKQLTVKANDKTITYGEAPAVSGDLSELTFSGFENGENASVVHGTVTFEYNYVQGQDVGDGSFEITPVITELSADNYTFVVDTVKGTLTVNKATLVLDMTATVEFGENVSEDNVTLSVNSGLVSSDDQDEILAAAKKAANFLFTGYTAGTTGVDQTNTITVSSVNGTLDNYTVEYNSCTLTIIKKTVAAPTIQSKAYNGTTQTADIDASEIYEVTENNGGIVVGDYDVRLTLIDTHNYKWADSEEAEITLVFTIVKADYDMSGVTFEDLTITYDKEEHSITVKGTLPSGVTVTYDGNGQTAVGEYTITATFTGDEQNYNPIPSRQAVLTILEISHDLTEIGFEDVTVKYDGEAHSIYIEGTLPTGVHVTYENNGQTDPNFYTVTAIFGDVEGEFDRMTATLTILRTHLQTADGFIVDSEDGFDPTLELVVEKIEEVARNYWAWQKDEVSERYAVKMLKDGEEVAFDGKITVRILLSEEFRENDLQLKSVARAGNIEYTRDGDYIVFETYELSEYVITCTYAPYFAIMIIVTSVLLADVLILIVLTVIVKKKRNKEVR